MSSHTATYLTDIAESELDDACPRKTWYARFEGGLGIVKKDLIVPALMMQETHRDLRTIANLIDLSESKLQEMVNSTVSSLTESDRMNVRSLEVLYRRLGWMVAFALYKEPQIRLSYDDIPVDEDVILDHDPLWVDAKPDRLLRNKETKDVVYWEYVPMPAGLTNKKWLDQWRYSARLHVGMAAVEDRKLDGVKAVTYGQVMGMAEGYTSLVDGRLIHPYVWGYRKRNMPGIWSTALTAHSGEEWVAAPVWEYPGGLVSWVKVCGDQVAHNQFQFSPLVMLNNAFVDQWCSRRLHREREVHTMKEVCNHNHHLRGIHFEKRTSQCVPASGTPCAFLGTCWDSVSEKEYVPNVIPQEATV